MIKYFSTFISGFEGVVEEILSKKDMEILKLSDGLVEFQSDKDAKEIRKWPFFNNSFLILEKFTDLGSGDFFKLMQEKIISDQGWVESIGLIENFRITYSNENELCSSDRNNNEQILTIIKETGARHNPHNPRTEFWFVRRSDNTGYFAKRLSSNTTNKHLEPEQLRPELCYLLNYLADTKYDEVVLDPFCGSGAIAKNCLHFFKPKLVFANDADEKFKKPLRSWSKKMNLKSKMIVKNMDATNLEGIEDGFVDKIICDPPWGFFQEIDKQEVFINKYLTEFERVLSASGQIVLLHGDKELFEDSLKKTNLITKKRYDILVNGKKAGIWILNKK